jgi:hypothetical protein
MMGAAAELGSPQPPAPAGSLDSANVYPAAKRRADVEAGVVELIVMMFRTDRGRRLRWRPAPGHLGNWRAARRAKAQGARLRARDETQGAYRDSGIGPPQRPPAEAASASTYLFQLGAPRLLQAPPSTPRCSL